MYKKDKSEVKQITRELLLSEVTTDPQRILTLCNKNFFIEKALYRKYLCGVECFEYDKRIYNVALYHKPRYVNLRCGDIFAQDLSQHPYGFVWLDLCNSYTSEIINKIVEFVAKLQFHKNATLVITLNKRRGTPSDKLLFNKYYSDYKNKGFTNHIGNFIKGEVKQTKRFEYSCFDMGKHQAHMQGFVFKIN